MLIKDTAVIERHALYDPVLEREAKQEAWAKAEIEHAVYVEDNDNSVANLDRQIGDKLTPERFTQLLKEFNPKLIVEVNPKNRTKATIYFEHPDGHKELLFPCENTPMPEFSVFSLREILVPTVGKVREIEVGGKKVLTKVISRADTGWIRVKVPYRELIRGWRTILGRLARRGLISFEEVERRVGIADRASWKNITGKGQEIYPW